MKYLPAKFLDSPSFIIAPIIILAVLASQWGGYGLLAFGVITIAYYAFHLHKGMGAAKRLSTTDEKENDYWVIRTINKSDKIQIKRVFVFSGAPLMENIPVEVLKDLNWLLEPNYQCNDPVTNAASQLLRSNLNFTCIWEKVLRENDESIINLRTLRKAKPSRIIKGPTFFTVEFILPDLEK